MLLLQRKYRVWAGLAGGAKLAFVSAALLVPVVHLLARPKLNAAIRLAVLAGGKGRKSSVKCDQSFQNARNIGVGVNLAARLWRLDTNSCIARALITWAICQRLGYKAEVVIGVAENANQILADTESSFVGHAWVEIDGTVVDDLPDVRQRYAAFDRPLLDHGGVYLGASLQG